MNDVKVIHIAFAVGNGEDQHISSLAHISAENAKNNILSIKVKKEENMDQLLDVIKAFNKED